MERLLLKQFELTSPIVTFRVISLPSLSHPVPYPPLDCLVKRESVDTTLNIFFQIGMLVGAVCTGVEKIDRSILKTRTAKWRMYFSMSRAKSLPVFYLEYLLLNLYGAEATGGKQCVWRRSSHRQDSGLGFAGAFPLAATKFTRPVYALNAQRPVYRLLASACGEASVSKIKKRGWCPCINFIRWTLRIVAQTYMPGLLSLGLAMPETSQHDVSSVQDLDNFTCVFYPKWIASSINPTANSQFVNCGATFLSSFLPPPISVDFSSHRPLRHTVRHGQGYSLLSRNPTHLCPDAALWLDFQRRFWPYSFNH